MGGDVKWKFYGIHAFKPTYTPANAKIARNATSGNSGVLTDRDVAASAQDGAEVTYG